MAKIIVLDDNQAILTITQDTLQNAGHDVTTICDSARINDLLSCQKYDLLITDIFMPDKEGLEVITYAKATYPDLKIIVMSGVFSFGDILSVALELGAKDKLLKPFTISELLTIVEQTLQDA
jgi:DNA-binding NtrC family response regulator